MVSVFAHQKLLKLHSHHDEYQITCTVGRRAPGGMGCVCVSFLSETGKGATRNVMSSVIHEIDNLNQKSLFSRQIQNVRLSSPFSSKKEFTELTQRNAVNMNASNKDQ